VKTSRLAAAAGLVAAALLSRASARPPQDAPAPPGGGDLSGLHAFDLRVGSWRAHHRVLKERLADSHEWMEYDGTQTLWQSMGGFANVDDNFFDRPGGAFHGVTVRTYDPKTGQWSIWWFDGRKPASDLDPPVRGRFENGVGTFYADDTLRGKPIRVRYVWSKITPASAHWEQAFSPDGGKTWETNWITEFRKAS
jgi:hypothetical protein